MVKPDKSNALLVSGVVAAPGIPDTDGDVLTKKEIKQLYTSFIELQADQNHSFIPLEGVNVIGNYITKSQETIAGREVPVGSWRADMLVFDSNLQDTVTNDDHMGLSIGIKPDDPSKLDISYFLKERLTYRDFPDKEDLSPKYISFVQGPANGYGLDTVPYETYILKSQKTEEPTMTEQNDLMAQIGTAIVNQLGVEILKSNPNFNPTPAPAPTPNPEPTMNYEERFDKLESQLSEINESYQKVIENFTTPQGSEPTPEPPAPEPSTGTEPTSGAEPTPEPVGEPVPNPDPTLIKNSGTTDKFTAPQQTNEPFFNDGFTPTRRDSNGTAILD